MKCRLCNKNSVHGDLCSNHFIIAFEQKVLKTIKDYKLINPNDKVIVAVSGGKDSLSLLNILYKNKFKVDALSIDEGISGYRDKTLARVKSFCNKFKIPHKIVTFKDFTGKTLDDILAMKTSKPCSICGVLRRHLLNQYSAGYDVLATGHNMDDEAQVILMNIMKGSTELLRRTGPVTGSNQMTYFTKRVKPFYFCSEKEVAVYAYLNNLNVEFSKCPNVQYAFRLRIRNLLNDLEYENPGTKQNIIKWFLHFKKHLDAEPSKHNVCSECGSPCSKEKCNTCNLKVVIKNVY